ncbi:MAG: aminotransferase class I/II-fold pyridoxal phosphate-dependent enzyme [Spirochaetaceae bacterium]|jgi:aspartate/methionine/tyrosine aminotransferase|nr:aminotransferase class I/II-fold pyridoxal phosphate-dependent enzyme [Spirochaetaceae bacterium]
MNHIACELNSILEGTVAEKMLSNFGKRIYFPKGIIVQSAEAKKFAETANATIGMAFHKGKPMILSALSDHLPYLSEAETVAYAPTAGVESVRELWFKHLLEKNPSLKAEFISLPVVVPGITAGISYMADIFFDKDQTVIINAPCWDNYSLIFEERREARLRNVSFLLDQSIDIVSITEAIEDEARTGEVRIVLNFPNNPAGYSPTSTEVDMLCECIYRAADSGANVFVLCDDAYYGLLYEDNTCKESIFCRLAGLHDRVLAVKADGPTKEDYVWGLRIAFITFGSKGLKKAHFDALIQKLMGTIRSSVSCSNTPAQFLLLKTFADQRTQDNKDRYFGILQRRYLAVRRFIDAHQNHPVLKALPFNSGYFMSFECTGISAESLRRVLLDKYGIGVIALGEKYIRIAFSALNEEQITPVLDTIFKAAEELA